MRMMKIAAAALALSFTAPTEAAVYLITYTGKITSGSDAAGLFGFSSGTDLTGMHYRSKYFLTYPNSANTINDHGETYIDLLWHPLSATLSINGITKPMPLNMASYESEFLLQIADGYGSELYTSVFGYTDDGVSLISADMVDSAFSPSGGFGYSRPYTLLPVNQSFSYTFGDGDSGGGGFSYNVSDLTNPLSLIKTLAWAKFQSKSVSYELFTGNAAAVPEPATWALMIVGFGGIGVALRRRVKHSPALIT